MKRYIVVIGLFLISSILLAGNVQAVTATPSAAPTKSPAPSAQDSESLSQKIDHLKSVLASKVAELKLVDKRGVIGVVQDSSTTQMTLQDTKGNTRLVDIDEITKFSSASAAGKFGISDIKKGMRVSVLGLYNKESKRILARFVSSFETPLYISGVVSDIDKINYLLTVTQEDGTSEKVDIENLTKLATYNADLDATKIGFSKVTAGTRIAVIGYSDPKEKNRMTASRVLLFDSLPADPKISVSVNAPTPTDTVTPVLKKKTTQ